jgi:hypothetical protein
MSVESDEPYMMPPSAARCPVCTQHSPLRAFKVVEGRRAHIEYVCLTSREGCGWRGRIDDLSPQQQAITEAVELCSVCSEKVRKLPDGSWEHPVAFSSPTTWAQRNTGTSTMQLLYDLLDMGGIVTAFVIELPGRTITVASRPPEDEDDDPDVDDGEFVQDVAIKGDRL